MVLASVSDACSRESHWRAVLSFIIFGFERFEIARSHSVMWICVYRGVTILLISPVAR